MHLSDEQFIEQFEHQTLAPEYFDHRGHLRLAWLYLQRYPLSQAVNKVTVGIKAYAASLGATDKFQHTLTEAIVRIMAVRMDRKNYSDLDSYLADNRDLVDDIWALVGKYYSRALLDSTAARERFVAPDLAPLTGTRSAGEEP